MYNTTPMRSGRMFLRPVMAAPDSLSEKIAKSIEHAKEACVEDQTSGECVVSWYEGEELSAAASHDGLLCSWCGWPKRSPFDGRTN
ncbi:calvin cycle protein CP12-1, chloroplastic [Tanacetum coccineum]